MSSLKNRWPIKVKYSSFRKDINRCRMLITQWLGWLHFFWHSKTTPLLQSTAQLSARSLSAEGHAVPLGFLICSLPVPWEAKDQPALGKEALNIVKKTDFDTGTFIRSSVRMRVLWPDPDHITRGQLYKNQGYCLARVALGCPGAECPHGPLSGRQGTSQLLWQASPGVSSSGWDSSEMFFKPLCPREYGSALPASLQHQKTEMSWSCPYHRTPIIHCDSLISKLLHRGLLFSFSSKKHYQFLTKQFLKKLFVFQLKEKIILREISLPNLFCWAAEICRAKQRSADEELGQQLLPE